MASNLIANDLLDERMLARARDVLAKTGRLHLPGVLQPLAAQALLQESEMLDWRLVFQGKQGGYDLKSADVAALDVSKRHQLLDLIHAQATDEFQYLFDSFRVSDEVDSGRYVNGQMADLYRWLNSEAGLQFLRKLTGDERCAYVDAQATRYRPGHFLTQHDDHAEGKDRLFAYVLNLTPQWIADWGGLLMFLTDDGHVAEAYTPRWNALNILKVPQPHAVSVVAPSRAARGTRLQVGSRSRRP
ncbi:MAG: 2OG-Fe(II) oxygenase [Hyphomonadaceae bacterium JAD_PAG50586_4]|nr:MAG: 2OG-Fe(II) oxygenase [Hyphomonadaceae bacterium JAD_PAG50586_4]